MDMWLVNQDEFDQLTPEGYTNINAFSTPDDLEGYTPIEDPFLKYSEDPPALIACVTHLSHRTWAIANQLFSVMGVTGSGKTTVKRTAHPIDYRQL